MSLSDKILILFEKYGSLSSERVKFLLKDEYKVEKTIRTVQRHIAELVKMKKLIRNPSIKREQTYTVNRKEPPFVSDFFLSRFWDELFEIRKELHKPKDQFSSGWDAFYKLRSLVRMLPKNLKEKIMPSIENFEAFNDMEAKEIKKDLEREIGARPILMPFEIDRRKRGETIIKTHVGRLLEKKVEVLIDNVATVLHEALREGAR